MLSYLFSQIMVKDVFRETYRDNETLAFYCCRLHFLFRLTGPSYRVFTQEQISLTRTQFNMKEDESKILIMSSVVNSCYGGLSSVSGGRPLPKNKSMRI